MALINREQALSHPFANGQYDKEHADEHFILGFEDYKEWLEDLPTVEAIPKADYEARLKADMVAILTDIQLEIEELNMHGSIQLQSYRQRTGRYRQGFERAQNLSTKIIQQKINSLKAESEDKE